MTRRRGQRACVLFGLCAVLSVACEAAGQNKSESASARLVADPPMVDFGTVGSLAPVEKTVLVKNLGRSDARIDGQRAGCRCAIINVENSTIAPGEAMRMTLSFDPSWNSGELSETVVLGWDSEAELEIPVRITIQDSLAIAPRSVAIETLVGDTDATSTFAISSIHGDPFTVELASAPRFVKCQIVKAANGEWQGRVVVKERLPLGEYVETIRLSTSAPEHKHILIECRVNVRTSLVGDRVSIVFKQREPITLRVSRLDGRSFKVAQVISETDAVRAEFLDEPRTSHEILCRLTEKPASHDTLRIEGDIEAGELLSIPVAVLLKEQSRSKSR